jgi:WD40 repeat protein
MMMNTLKSVLWVCLFFAVPLSPIDETITQQDDHSRQITQVTQMQYPFVSDINWSPDGSRVAIVSFPSIRILDADTWRTVVLITNARVSEAVWNSDGTQIASVAGGNPSSLYIRDARTGRLLRHLTINYEFQDGVILPMFRLAWSPDDTLIVSDRFANNILIWNLATGEVNELGSLTSGRVGDVDWSPDSARVVGAWGDGTIQIWDIETGRQLFTAEGFPCVDWHPVDDKILGVSFVDNGRFAIVWDVNSGKELLRMDHGASIRALRWNGNGSLIATGGRDGVVNVWDGQSGAHIAAINEHSELITTLAWHPTQDLIASASFDGRVVVSRIE